MKSGQMAKLALIYTVSSLVVQIFSMVLVPIYTHNMRPEQFGQLQLINTIQSILSIFITLGINSGLTRFYKEHDDGNKLKNTAVTFSLLSSVVFTIVVLIIREPIAKLLFGDVEPWNSYLLYIVLIASFSSLTITYTVYYSMQYKVWRFGFVQMARAALLVFITYYFLVVKESGVIGALQAQVITYGLIFAGCLIMDIKSLRFKLGVKEFKPMAQYGLGLAPGTIANWIYTLIDRYFIQYMIDLRAVAIYSMGYRVGMLMEPLFLSPFKSVFTAYKYEVYKHEDGKDKIKQMYTRYNFIGWYVLLIITVGAEIAIQLLATHEYKEAMYIVPLIALSYYFAGLSEFYSLGIHIANKPMIGSTILGVAAIINIAGNIVLIPILGIYGAGFATVVSYLVINVLNFVIGRKYYRLDLNYFAPFVYLIVVLPLYALYVLLTRMTDILVLKLLIDLLVILLFPLLTVITRIVPFAVVLQSGKMFAKKLKLKKK